MEAAFAGLDVLTTGPSAYLHVWPWGPLFIASIAAAVGAGRGIASERKWGYQLGVAVALFPFVLRVLVTGDVNAVLGRDLLNLMVEVAVVALLLHTQSREYQRVWFK
jgi:hypothetical protein